MYDTHTYPNNAGLKRKVWSKLSAVRPAELRELIQILAEDATPIVKESTLVKIQTEQRRLWSAHVKEQRMTKTIMQTEKEEKKIAVSLQKKQVRNQKLREYEALKRQRAKQVCKGLPRVLVPTNIPDKHGYDPTVLKVCN